MKFASLFLILISLSVLSPRAVATDVSALDAQLSEAVLALMDGDEQAERGNLPAAVSLYEQSLALLRQIQVSDPGFNTNIVDFRIENIEAKLTALAGQVRTEPPGGAVAAAKEDSTHFERLYLEAKEQAIAHSQRLLDVERRNLDLQLALREREQALNRQREEIQEAQRELARLRREKETLDQNSTRELQDLRRFNNLLQDRANQVEAENTELSETLAVVRERDAERAVLVQSLRSDLLTAEQALEEAQIAGDAEQENLRERLRDCAEESRDRFEQLENASTEIETLRGQLAGLPLLEETVIELNRRLNRQTAELEVKEALEETVAQQRGEVEELRNTLAGNLSRLTETLNELTQTRRILDEQTRQVETLRERLAAGEYDAALEEERLEENENPPALEEEENGPVKEE